MNCTNCGAAMELHAARHYFFCAHCGSFHFPETVGDDGVKVLEPEGDTSCPVCDKALAEAVVDDRIEARYCQQCRGVLLSRANFATVVEQRRMWASTPPVIPAPLDPRELGRALMCPQCAGDMSTHPYYGPGSVVIDTCQTCHVVWLDFGELRQIADAPGSDRGRAVRPRNRDELDVLEILASRVGRREEEDDR
jgi:Zn-finger nucleic acid-binding protein